MPDTLPIPAQKSAARHRWKFFRAGRLDQVQIRHGRDLANLENLDQKLWVALSCPTHGVEFDPATLDLIDTDHDSHVRAPELLAAIRWTVSKIKNPDDLLKGEAALPLAAIDGQDEAGAKILAGARRILANLGKGDATVITLADTADTSKIFAQTKFNGDGIIPADSAADEATKNIINDIIACVGSETDRSGQPGLSQAKVDVFFNEAKAFSLWNAEAEREKKILSLGPLTAAAFEAFKAVRVKINDFFARCAVTAFDERAAAAMNLAETEYAAMAGKDLLVTSEEIARFPLAKIEPDRPLPLKSGLNPAWTLPMEHFRREAVVPLLGDKPVLTLADWETIRVKFSPYETWLSAKAGQIVEKLGLAWVRAILDSSAQAAITSLIAQDAALAGENAQINDVAKLIRFYRDLNTLAHNYVNLGDFYDPTRPAIFQIGRLYLDGRACDLCFEIDDMGKHAMLAGASKIFLAYCEITRPATGQKKTICAAMTAGFADPLWVGRNGIFYDRQGRDWDAVIVKVVENPISIKEAFWMPWKKMASMIGEQMKKLVAAREAAATSAATSAAAKTAGEVAKPSASATPPTGTKLDGAAMASSVAAIGIAVGLLGSAVAGLVTMISGLPLWKTLLGATGTVLAASCPSMIIAYFKLRARDLAPILNACGWAVNGRILMTMSLARLLTQEAKLPAGAERQLTDPYADKHGRRNFLLGLLFIVGLLYIAWHFHLLDCWLPSELQPAYTQAIPTVNPPK